MTKSTKVRRAKGFGERFGSMLSVDAKRMFGSPMLYIMLLIAAAVTVPTVSAAHAKSMMSWRPLGFCQYCLRVRP